MIFRKVNMQKAIVFVFLFSSCAFQKNILFQIPKEVEQASTDPTLQEAAFGIPKKAYTIEKFDKVVISIFTNEGEILVDPNKEFQIGGVEVTEKSEVIDRRAKLQIDKITNPQEQGAMNANNSPPSYYTVNERGFLVLPLIKEIFVTGLTAYQLDSLLSLKYSEFYTQAFVKTEIISKKVFLIGALGNQVIPLNSEAQTLFDIMLRSNPNHQGNTLDLIHSRSRNSQIKIIRKYKEQYVLQIIDLTTFEGLQKAQLLIQPNDLIYIEPRRSASEGDAYSNIQKVVSSVTSIFASVTSVLTLYLLVQNQNK